MISAWSYSRLKNYEQCPHRAFLAYVEKRPEPPEIDKKAANRGTEIHTQIENYIRGDSDELTNPALKAKHIIDPLRDEYRAGNVELEGDWGFTATWATCDYFDPNVWARMKLDALHVTGPFSADAYDWKSGKKFGNEVAHAQQGQQYVIGTFMRRPELEHVTTRFVYVDQADCGPPTVREYTRAKAMSMFKSINDRAIAMTTATTFPAKPNKINCRFCPYGPNNKGDRSCQWGVEL